MASDVDTRTVRFLAVPAEQARAIVVYRNDMIRELQLIELGRAQGVEEPSQLYDLAELLRADLQWVRDNVAGDSVWSVEEGAPSGCVDVVVQAAPEAAWHMYRVLERYEELNQLSRHGQLLTEAATPEMMRLARWVADEMERQLLHDATPRPYPMKVG